MLSYKKLRMLTIILVYNVSLHMYMHCVMELKSSSCGYQLMHSAADYWSSIASRRSIYYQQYHHHHYYYYYYYYYHHYYFYLYFFIHKFISRCQLYIQDKHSLFKLLLLWDGSSSWLKLSGTCCCWIESIIPSTRSTTDPVDCVFDCVHNKLLGSD